MKSVTSILIAVILLSKVVCASRDLVPSDTHAGKRLQEVVSALSEENIPVKEGMRFQGMSGSAVDVRGASSSQEEATQMAANLCEGSSQKIDQGFSFADALREYPALFKTYQDSRALSRDRDVRQIPARQLLANERSISIGRGTSSSEDVPMGPLREVCRALLDENYPERLSELCSDVACVDRDCGTQRLVYPPLALPFQFWAAELLVHSKNKEDRNAALLTLAGVRKGQNLASGRRLKAEELLLFLPPEEASEAFCDILKSNGSRGPRLQAAYKLLESSDSDIQRQGVTFLKTILQIPDCFYYESERIEVAKRIAKFCPDEAMDVLLRIAANNPANSMLGLQAKKAVEDLVLNDLVDMRWCERIDAVLP